MNIELDDTKKPHQESQFLPTLHPDEKYNFAHLAADKKNTNNTSLYLNDIICFKKQS